MIAAADKGKFPPFAALGYQGTSFAGKRSRPVTITESIYQFPDKMNMFWRVDKGFHDDLLNSITFLDRTSTISMIFIQKY